MYFMNEFRVLVRIRAGLSVARVKDWKVWKECIIYSQMMSHPLLLLLLFTMEVTGGHKLSSYDL